jgi:hypothetical protein
MCVPNFFASHNSAAGNRKLNIKHQAMLGRRFGGFSDQYMAVVARLLLSGTGRGAAMSLAMGAPGSELDRGRLVGAMHAMLRIAMVSKYTRFGVEGDMFCPAWMTEH